MGTDRKLEPFFCFSGLNSVPNICQPLKYWLPINQLVVSGDYVYLSKLRYQDGWSKHAEGISSLLQLPYTQSQVRSFVTILLTVQYLATGMLIS